jgi:transcriptional regulator with XRE-family HTH domain
MRSTSTTPSANRVSELQDRLRRIATQRISAGVVTGTRLARDTGFKQAHISNFLHGHRGLSVEGFDRLLKALHLRVTDLVEFVSEPTKELLEYEDVPVVSGATAIQPDFGAVNIDEILRFKRAFLRSVRPSMSGRRGEWRRFIALRPDALNGSAMHPRLSQTSTLLIDRHYNTLKPYSDRESNIYAVAKGGTSIIRYVEAADGRVILRPMNPSAPIQLLATAGRDSISEAIIGRVCHIGTEL